MVIGMQKRHGVKMDDYRKQLIQKYFPKKEWKRAYQVMMGESGGNPDAVGDTKPIRGVKAPSVGLFQIRTLPGRPSAEQLKDPEFNVKYAAQMQKEQGWKPWTAARKLGYTKATILAPAEENIKSVGGEAKANMDTTFTAKANRWAKEARKHGWSESQIQDFIDQKATIEGVKTGDISVKNVKDPSTLIKLKEEGIDIKEALLEDKDVLDRTKEYLSNIEKETTKEDALKSFEFYKPIMEKEGVDTKIVEEAINKKWPEEVKTTEEKENMVEKLFSGYELKGKYAKAAEEAPGVFEKVKKAWKGYEDFFMRLNPYVRKKV